MVDETKKYKLVDLSKEEGDAISKEITAVLIKYDAEMLVKSTIEIMKRVEDVLVGDKSVPSPYVKHPDDNQTPTSEEGAKA